MTYLILVCIPQITTSYKLQLLYVSSSEEKINKLCNNFDFNYLFVLFFQYGFNRISQVCETHIAGYDFVVLNNAFLVHHGFKTKEGFHSAKDEENNRNRDIFRTFKKELKLKYRQSTRHC